MSTEIKPGQEWYDRSYPGGVGVIVESVTAARVHYRWNDDTDIRGDRDVTNFLSLFERADPSKVTVEITDWEDFRPGDVVVQKPTSDAVEGAAFLVERHQPVPEPEPEWKPGTVALATTPSGADEQVMRTTAYGPLGPVWLDTHSNRLHASEVTDVRPLVVIDPAAVDWSDLQGQVSVLVTGSFPFKRAAKILAMVRRELGIEL